ncbi:unnamed protein product, partial [Discosporangium mesarthrocarpum]
QKPLHHRKTTTQRVSPTLLGKRVWIRDDDVRAGGCLLQPVSACNVTAVCQQTHWFQPSQTWSWLFSASWFLWSSLSPGGCNATSLSKLCICFKPVKCG